MSRREPHPMIGGSVPRELEPMLAEILKLPGEQQEARVSSLVCEYPDLATTFWCWLASARREESTGARSDAESSGGSVPEAIGRYRILRRLGQGGMGSVLAAEHIDLGRRVAIKIVRPDLVDRPSARERFRREVLALSRLDHPGVCPVYDVGEHQGTPYMVMPLLAGADLGHLLAEARAGESTSASGCDGLPPSSTVAPPAKAPGKPDLWRVVRLFERAARALHVAHEAGLIHRDIKPANLFVTNGGEPVLLDFGLARDLLRAGQRLSGSKEVLGSAEYLAPERLDPRGRQADRRSDIYSLGVVLYESLCLKHPFEVSSEVELLERIQNASPVPLDRRNRNVPKELTAVVACAMEKDPERRYPTAEHFAEDLRRVADSEPILARPSGPVQRLRSWTRRNPLPAVLLVALTVASLLSLVVLGERDRSLSREAVARADTAASLDRFNLLAVGVRLREAIRVENDLYPAWPQRAEALRRWLVERGEPLALELTGLRAALANLSAGPRDEAEQFLARELTRVVGDLEAFVEPKRGDLPRARERLAWAKTVQKRTIDDFADAWARTRAEITRCGRYGDLELVPQIDLVPLGTDPSSGLFEFGHPRSGAVPARDPSTGRLSIDGETGLVFVLIPGGAFHMGAQSRSSTDPNHDPRAIDRERPVQRVELRSFFLSKYELTQGQWLRLVGEPNPSVWRAGEKVGLTTITLAHPVENVSWRDCDALMYENGLELPTEAQWECACRGGGSSPWWTGSEPESLIGKVNMVDREAMEHNAKWPRPELLQNVTDGYVAHAPVDSMAPNAFGLHHIAGNVSEWCRDGFAFYGRVGFAPGDGRRTGGDDNRIFRGGSCGMTPDDLRSASRYVDRPEAKAAQRGCRPARPILP